MHGILLPQPARSGGSRFDRACRPQACTGCSSGGLKARGSARDDLAGGDDRCPPPEFPGPGEEDPGQQGERGRDRGRERVAAGSTNLGTGPKRFPAADGHYRFWHGGRQDARVDGLLVLRMRARPCLVCRGSEDDGEGPQERQGPAEPLAQGVHAASIARSLGRPGRACVRARKLTDMEVSASAQRLRVGVCRTLSFDRSILVQRRGIRCVLGQGAGCPWWQAWSD